MPAQEFAIPLSSGTSVQTRYKIFGGSSSAEPVGAIFANGWGCSSETTEGPAEALADQGFTVVTFEPERTAKLTTGDRVRIMQMLGGKLLGHYVAMGFSLGGDVATRVAYEDYASRSFDVAGLVDVAGSHGENDRFLTGMVARAPEEAFADPDGILFSVYLDTLASSTSPSIRAYGEHVSRMTAPEIAAYHFAACDSMREGEVGGSLDQLLLYQGGPTFYIHGSESRPPYLDDIKWQDRIRIREIANSGHFVHADAPGAYIGALTEALVEVNGR